MPHRRTPQLDIRSILGKGAALAQGAQLKNGLASRSTISRVCLSSACQQHCDPTLPCSSTQQGRQRKSAIVLQALAHVEQLKYDEVLRAEYCKLKELFRAAEAAAQEPGSYKFARTVDRL